MIQVKHAILLAGLFLLAACDEEQGLLGGKGKSGKKDGVDKPESKEVAQPAAPGTSSEARCQEKWNAFRSAFRVGDRLRYTTTDDGTVYPITVTTLVSNEDIVDNSWLRMNRIEYLATCRKDPSSFDKEGGTEPPWRERLTVPGGTFDTECQRTIQREPSSQEMDTTRCTFLKGGRRVLVRELVLITVVESSGVLARHRRLTELVEYAL